LNGQKKTEDEEIGVDKELQQMRFDRYDIQHEKKLLEVAREAREEEEEKQKKIRDFLEEQAKEDEITRLSMLESKRQAEERKAKEQERIKPDLTEVIEPEAKMEEPAPKREVMGMLGTRLVDNKSGKVVEPPKPELPDPAMMTDLEDGERSEQQGTVPGRCEPDEGRSGSTTTDNTIQDEFLPGHHRRHTAWRHHVRERARGEQADHSTDNGS
jgi:hypothetical protein